MKNIYKRIIRLVPPLGVMTLLAALSSAGEMTDGVHRITRDDVNPAGAALNGGGFLLTGSVGGIETVMASAGGFQVTPGLPKIYFYPDTVSDVTPSPVSNTQIDFTWTAPAAEILQNKTASSYVVKYSSVTPLTDQFAFAAATTLAAPAPQAPNSLETLSLTGLQYRIYPAIPLK